MSALSPHGPQVDVRTRHADLHNLSNEPPQPAGLRWRGELILLILTLAVLLPFLNRAFNIDEPLFIWAAQHIRADPKDFYGFPVNWYGKSMWMSDVMKNPPLASYYIALVSSILGTSEVALHTAFLLPAIALVLGTYRLALDVAARPLLAAVLSILSPVALISATSVMCDIMMLAFWVWSLHLWLRGLREDRFSLLAAATALAALGALTKYFGISLIPLMLVVGFTVRRRPGLFLIALVIPIVILAAYEIWTYRLYFPGKPYLRGHVVDALFYSSEYRTRAGTKRLVSIVTGFSFTGGACIGLVPYLIASATRTGWIVFAAIALPTLALVALVNPFPAYHSFRSEAGVFAAGYFIQFALLSAVGIAVLLTAIVELHRWRSAGSLVLALWVLGTFAFAALVNWSVNGRSMLPLVPAAAMIVARRLDARSPTSSTWEHTWGIVPAALLSLVCAAADAALANTTRQAAREIAARAARYESPVYINGKWGFQYYLQVAGARPLEAGKFALRRGDLVATAFNNTNLLVLKLPPDSIEPLWHIERVPFPFVSTMHMDAHAGFYSDVFGPLPFRFGKVLPEQFELIMLTALNLPEAKAEVGAKTAREGP